MLDLKHPRYAVLEMLGQGGQGQVFRALDLENPEAKLVAKVVRQDKAESSASLRACIMQEFSVLARLSITGVVFVRDLIWFGEQPVLIEDFIEGVSPEAYVHSSEDGRGERLRALIVQVLQTLSDLHDAGFVHGDLKPEHLRVTETGKVILLDFGAAALTSSSSETRTFTRALAAPEVLAGSPQTVRSELYTLAKTIVAIGSGSVLASSMRRGAPWVDDTVHALVEQCLREHPYDRLPNAEAALALLDPRRIDPSRFDPSRFAKQSENSRSLPLVGRDDVLLQLAVSQERVLYLCGPGGMGKSRVIRALAARGREQKIEVRALCFPEDAQVAPRLAAFLRGDLDAWPFLCPKTNATWLTIDDVDQAGPDLQHALDFYRCCSDQDANLPRVVVTAQAAPVGAPTIVLPPIDQAVWESAPLGEIDSALLHTAILAANGNPSLLMAALGRGRPTPNATLEQVRALAPAGQEAIVLLALAGGNLPRNLKVDAWTKGAGLLVEAGLALRRGARVVLVSRELGAQIAEQLGDVDKADVLSDALLKSPDEASVFLSLAKAPHMPSRRNELLIRAARAFRTGGERTLEHETLALLLADPQARTLESVVRYERLARELGSPLHRDALTWLTDLGDATPAVHILAQRRSAESQMRAGEHTEAQRIVDALLLQHPHDALVHSTQASVLLFQANWKDAEKALEIAYGLRAQVLDEEELARIEHNRGVVLIYRGDYQEAALAMQKSAARKQRLGDRAGMRASLLNLGLALAKLDHCEKALRIYGDAAALARTLQQVAGLAWCLAGITETQMRMGRLNEAGASLQEALTLREQCSAVVRNDLVLLESELLSLQGRGPSARQLLQTLLEHADTLTAARAHYLSAKACLAQLPIERQKAGRHAVSAIRLARAGAHTEQEAQALSLLQALREPSPVKSPEPIAETMPQPSSSQLPIWSLATGNHPELELLRAVLSESKAERAFLAAVAEDNSVSRVFGCDRDGLAVAEAKARIPEEVARQTTSANMVVYLREAKFGTEHGSQMACAGPEPKPGLARAVLVLEHRYRTGAFDAFEASRLQAYVALGQLVLHATNASLSPQVERGSGAEPPQTASASGAAGAPRGSVSRAAGAPRGRVSGGNGPTMDHDSSLDGPLTTWTKFDAERRSFPTIVGQSAALNQALYKLDLATDSALPVLLTGETGVGKEVFARALHDSGPRKAQAFVAINCGAIPESLFEAELFGHARGAFTGADKERVGLIAKAEGGTLFLDEVGELPLARQATLLRALDSRTYRRVGGDEDRKFDVRIVTATNRDLEAMSRLGNFRTDLIFRINVIPIHIPPLRDRTDDVPILIRTLLQRRNLDVSFTEEALAILCRYRFPGNVRELVHILERLSLVRGRIDVKSLPREVRDRQNHVLAPVVQLSQLRDKELGGSPSDTKARTEVQRALDRNKGNITHAAKTLGITRHGLKKRMLRLGMREESQNLAIGLKGEEQ
jgi:serine/threonine-protein kinase PknK